MKYAIVKNNEVTNIVEWDGEGEYNPDGELVAATEDTKIGGSWDGNVFTFVEPEPAPDTRDYAQKRRDAYASVGDQLDMQYHDSVNGSRTWLDHVESVKDEYPKP